MNVITTAGVPIKAWTDGVPVEPDAIAQVRNVAAMPFVYKHVALMPDVHKGIGATVGSVVATKGAIIPAAVGVDIGCGMMARRLTLTASQLPDNLAGLRSAIEAAVPHGRTDDGGANDKGTWAGAVPATADYGWQRLFSLKPACLDAHPKAMPKRDPATHLGTLGTGNHFIELAKEDMRRWYINLPDKDLAYLPEGTEHFNDYIAAVSWAQEYAASNRDHMMMSVIEAIRSTGELPAFEGDSSDDSSAVQCHHNYVAREHHFGHDVIVTRKGAVRARSGDYGIIPGSMGARSYIVRGLGNSLSFHSCSHGAGRVMSRTEAKRRFTLADHEAATAGVECRKDEGVLDETPAAYKNIDAVMEAQRDLVDVVHTLKQVLCVKG